MNSTDRRLTVSTPEDEALESAGEYDSYLMDSFGRSLLKELQENSRMSVAELSRRVGLSATATAERLRQMEEQGILRSYTVTIDRLALGLDVMAFIRMTCDGQHYYRLMEFIQTLEEVREFHHLTGGDAFLLKVTTTSMAALESLIEALLPYGNPVTSLVLSTPIEARPYNVTGNLTSAPRRNRGSARRR